MNQQPDTLEEIQDLARRLALALGYGEPMPGEAVYNEYVISLLYKATKMLNITEQEVDEFTEIMTRAKRDCRDLYNLATASVLFGASWPE